MQEEKEVENTEALKSYWDIVKVIPSFYDMMEDAEPGELIHIDEKYFISMSDVWAWATSDGFFVNNSNVKRIAELFQRYGFCGLLYYQQYELKHWKCSEFTDNNRMIQFVYNEEKIRKEVPDYNKRGYAKYTYTITGEPKDVVQPTA